MAYKILGTQKTSLTELILKRGEGGRVRGFFHTDPSCEGRKKETSSEKTAIKTIRSRKKIKIKGGR